MVVLQVSGFWSLLEHTVDRRAHDHLFFCSGSAQRLAMSSYLHPLIADINTARNVS